MRVLFVVALLAGCVASPPDPHGASADAASIPLELAECHAMRLVIEVDAPAARAAVPQEFDLVAGTLPDRVLGAINLFSCDAATVRAAPSGPVAFASAVVAVEPRTDALRDASIDRYAYHIEAFVLDDAFGAIYAALEEERTIASLISLTAPAPAARGSVVFDGGENTFELAPPSAAPEEPQRIRVFGEARGGYAVLDGTLDLGSGAGRTLAHYLLAPTSPAAAVFGDSGIAAIASVSQGASLTSAGVRLMPAQEGP